MDISQAIAPKSDQLNAEDLIAGPITAQIQQVEVRQTTDQPISLFLVGHPRPWKPCKSVLRVMAAIWSTNSASWAGQSVTLYNDPDVKWAGKAVGGIRISHMTGLEKKRSFNLAVAKGKRAPVVIEPLNLQAPVQQEVQQPAVQRSQQPTQADVDHYGQLLQGVTTIEDLQTVWVQIPPEVKKMVTQAKDAKKSELASAPQEPAPQPAQDGIENF